MNHDIKKVIAQVAAFTGFPLTVYKILQLENLLRIDNFRKSMLNSVSGDRGRQEQLKTFIRKGKVGDWKNYFTEEKVKVWDRWIDENLVGTDIPVKNLKTH